MGPRKGSRRIFDDLSLRELTTVAGHVLGVFRFHCEMSRWVQRRCYYLYPAAERSQTAFSASGEEEEFG